MKDRQREKRDLQRNYQIGKIYIIGKPFARPYWKNEISFYGSLCNIERNIGEWNFGNFRIKYHVTGAVKRNNSIGQEGYLNIRILKEK